jgi:hypothetical protein
MVIVSIYQTSSGLDLIDIDRVPRKFHGSDLRMCFQSHIFKSSYSLLCSPFHGAIGIVTCRVLIHLRKFNLESMLSRGKTSHSLGPLDFGHPSGGRSGSNWTTQVGLQSASATTDTKRSVLPLHSVHSLWLDDSGSEPTVRFSNSAFLTLNIFLPGRKQKQLVLILKVCFLPTTLRP